VVALETLLKLSPETFQETFVPHNEEIIINQSDSSDDAFVFNPDEEKV
jgi:hypothetical protein